MAPPSPGSEHVFIDLLTSSSFDSSLSPSLPSGISVNSDELQILNEISTVPPVKVKPRTPKQRRSSLQLQSQASRDRDRDLEREQDRSWSGDKPGRQSPAQRSAEKLNQPGTSAHGRDDGFNQPVVEDPLGKPQDATEDHLAKLSKTGASSFRHPLLQQSALPSQPLQAASQDSCLGQDDSMPRGRLTSLVYRNGLQQVSPSSPRGQSRSHNVTPKTTPKGTSKGTPKSTPKQTPQKPEWTIDTLKSSLRVFSRELREAHRNLCSYTIRSATPVDSRVHQGRDWFAHLNMENVPEEKGVTMKMKVRVGYQPKSNNLQAIVYMLMLL